LIRLIQKILSIPLVILLSCAFVIPHTTLGEQPEDRKLDERAQPKFHEMEVSLTILGYQGKKYPEGRGKGTSGCSSGFDPKVLQRSKVNGQFTCGFPGEVSRVNWWYLGTDKEGDHYEFARQFPYEDLDQKVPKKEVVFRGKPVVVYQDESHRIMLQVRKRKDDEVKPKAARR